MEQEQYDFLTGVWAGEKGREYAEAFEFCRSFGWCRGFDLEGRPVLTTRGVQAIKAYQYESKAN